MSAAGCANMVSASARFTSSCRRCSSRLEKQGRFDRADLPQPPGQGLTSVSFDRSTPKGFYRVVGFRLCGPRAVRIDMLERLGDLIRERVFWKPRFENEPRPQGSVAGGGFAIVPDMMSLVGCSGEEFAAILRSLGFRMLKRPLPAANADAKQNSPEGAPPAELELAAARDDSALQASVEAAGASLPEPSPAEASAPSPPQQEPEPQAAGPAANDTAPQPAPAEAMAEVWWPKDTGPFRQQSQHQKPRKKSHHSQKAKPPESSPATQPHKPARPEVRKPQKPERPVVNPDSPFAVLGVLRSQLAEKKNA